MSNNCVPARPGPTYAAEDFCEPGELTPDIRACLQTPSADCDRLFSGLCRADAFRQTTICACMNNRFSCAYQTSKKCATLADGFQAYIPTTQTRNCDKTTICMNVVNVNGNENDMSSVLQSCNNDGGGSASGGNAGGGNGGASGSNTPAVPAHHWALIATVAIGFILLIALLWVVLGRRDESANATVAAELAAANLGPVPLPQ